MSQLVYSPQSNGSKGGTAMCSSSLYLKSEPYFVTSSLVVATASDDVWNEVVSDE